MLSRGLSKKTATIKLRLKRLKSDGNMLFGHFHVSLNSRRGGAVIHHKTRTIELKRKKYHEKNSLNGFPCCWFFFTELKGMSACLVCFLFVLFPLSLSFYTYRNICKITLPRVAQQICLPRLRVLSQNGAGVAKSFVRSTSP